MTGSRVVVGLDESPESEAALRWAGRYAAQRHLPVELVHAVPTWPYDAFLTGGDLTHGEHLVAAGTRALAATAPGVPVTTHVEVDGAAALLLRRAADAALVVVGARGRGGFPGLHLGSVAAQVAAHAPCPVVVPREPEGRGVVVGVDGSPASERAVALAFAEADAHGEPLTAVHAWLPAYAGLADVPYPGDLSVVAAEEDEVLAERLAGHRERHPDVDVRTVVRCAHPVATLLDEAEGARLLVVGSHGRGGFAAMLLGSVSRSLLHTAPCTLVVVRDGTVARSPAGAS